MKIYYLPLSVKYKLPANDFFESKDLLNQIYFWCEDLQIKEFTEQEYLLLQVPIEFQSVLSYLAYEKGHSAGEEEVLNILRGLIFNLKPAIEKFEARIKIG